MGSFISSFWVSSISFAIADTVTPSMEKALRETERRRALQQQYNAEHGITPKTIKKDVSEILEISTHKNDDSGKKKAKKLSAQERRLMIEQLKKEMKNAAKLLEFEHAAYLRDRIKQLQE